MSQPEPLTEGDLPQNRPRTCREPAEAPQITPMPFYEFGDPDAQGLWPVRYVTLEEALRLFAVPPAEPGVLRTIHMDEEAKWPKETPEVPPSEA